MLRDASGGRRTSLLVDGAFVAIVLVYLASASRFFEHVEDAVISYTYARNAAEGYGFVPNIGGERVEGFSDPLWVFLLTGGQLLGVTPFVTSRVLGIFFAIGELALVYRIALDALSPGAAAPEPGARDPRPAALLAPAMLACMPGFAMWNHMGLENPLYGLLLSLATWLQLRELGDPRRRPWSALAALGLLLTRPEAPLYVAILLVHRVARRGALRREALRRTGAWVALVAVPFAAFIVWRFAYFGWPLPMPYYVKLAEKRTPTLAALLHGDDPGLAYLSEGLVTLRLAPLLGLAVLAPLLRRDRRDACLLLLAQCAGACFFAVYSGGDWMKGWRWLHTLTSPLAPLAAAGLLATLDRLATRLLVRARPGVVRAARTCAATTVFALASMWPAASVTPKLAADPPVLGGDVHERLDHWVGFARAFFLDDYSIMDGDQGALTYFAPPGVRTIDPVGLNDVVAAQHRRAFYSRPFFHEYFFEVHRPTFYGPRRSPTSVPKDYPEWARDYVVLPAYPSARLHRAMHGGWMRKDAFRVDELPDDARAGDPVAFDCGLVLRGARVVAPVVDTGAPARLEAYWQRGGPVDDGFDYFVEVTLLDAAGAAERRIVRPILHQAYAPSDWTPEELLRDPEELVAATPGPHALAIALERARRKPGDELHTVYGPDPLPVDVPAAGLERCRAGSGTDPVRVATVDVDHDLAERTAAELDAAVDGGPLPSAREAARRLALVLGPGSARVSAARTRLSARVRVEELAEGRRLVAEGHDRAAADALLRARAEEVRDREVNALLDGISRRMQAAALAKIDAEQSRAETCEGFRGLLEAVAVYPPNSHARALAEMTRPDCWSLLSQVDLGEVDAAGAVQPDPARRVVPRGLRVGLRFRWRAEPELRDATLPLVVRVLAPDGSTPLERTVSVGSKRGDATVAQTLDLPGRWRFEATLEGRVEASLPVDVETAP